MTCELAPAPCAPQIAPPLPVVSPTYSERHMLIVVFNICFWAAFLSRNGRHCHERNHREDTKDALSELFFARLFSSTRPNLKML